MQTGCTSTGCYRVVVLKLAASPALKCADACHSPLNQECDLTALGVAWASGFFKDLQVILMSKHENSSRVI